MSNLLDKKTLYLANKYPDLFVDINKACRQSSMAYGCMCGDGWLKLLDETFAKITGSGVKLLQVKEKFGALVIYLETVDGSECPQFVKDAINPVYESSRTICEVCGEAGKLVKNARGYLKTLCSKHCEEMRYTQEIYRAPAGVL